MKIKITFLILILVSILSVSGFVIAKTPDYPVPELGNCGNKAACKEYCDNPSHAKECLDFAKEHKMMTEEEIRKAESMIQIIAEGGGPGGCQSKTACQAYCENIDHLEECIAFTEEHNFISEKELDKIKAMVRAHKKGVTPPGNCQTKTECEAYCEEVNHIEECLEYADEVGFTPPGDVKKAREMVRLMKLGKTPGRCQSKAECEAYCEDEKNMEECLDFSVETGEMSEEEAKRIKEEGPKKAGPGDCQSHEECEKYCNEHQRECLIFAKENGLMTEEEIKMIEQDLAQLKIGIEEASPEAVECIKNKLGEETIRKIKNGEYIPGPETGQKINQCMKQHEKEMAQEFANSLKNAPEIVITCLKEKFGEKKFNDFRNGQLPQNSEEGELIESCFQKAVQMSEQEMKEKLNELKQALENASSETINCLNQVRSNFVDEIKSGEYVPTSQDEENIIQCFEKFAPEEPADKSKEMTDEEIIENVLNKIPTEAKECVRSNLTQSIIEKLKAKEGPTEELKSIMEKCVAPMELDDKQPPKDMEQKPMDKEMMEGDKQPPKDMEQKPMDKEMMEDDKQPPKDMEKKPEEEL